MAADAFHKLRKELESRGCYERPTFRIVAELLINVTLTIAGIAVFAMSASWFVKILGLIVSTAGGLGVGTNTHTSAHDASSDKKWVNHALTYFGYPFFFGLSATFWRYQHNQIHHGSPNVIGVDQDADLSPWFAMTDDEVQQASGIRRFYYKHLQYYAFCIALSINYFNIQTAGIVHLIRAMVGRRDYRSQHWVDVGALVGHVTATLIIPMFFFAPLDVAGLYLFRGVLFGYGMFAILAPGHFPREAVRMSRHLKQSDYLGSQTAATINYKTGRLGKLICSGLQYQIEHHLFPGIPYVHLPRTSQIVERFCETEGLWYRQYGWDRAIWKSLSTLRHPSRIETDASCMRKPVETDQLVVSLDEESIAPALTALPALAAEGVGQFDHGALNPAEEQEGDGEPGGQRPPFISLWD